MGHTFYFYEQEGKFTDITWELNESFGNFTCGCTREELIAFYIDEPSCGGISERPLLA